jgi:Zn-dependent peptidase ImmA (M78 family)
MKIQNRPYYSASEIELKSKKLLTTFLPEYFTSVKPTPLTSIVNFLKTQYNIVFNFDVTLGFNLNNNRIFGACNPIKRVIFIDSAIKQDEHKFNFTLAHELGHLSLHRKIKITHEPDDDNSDVETIRENSFYKKELKSDSDWIEWQANYYASALLMPDDILATKLSNIQKQLGARVGRIYVDNQTCNQQRFYEIIDLLSKYFQVSKTAVKYRLYSLKLVDDQRKQFLRDYINDIL